MAYLVEATADKAEYRRALLTVKGALEQTLRFLRAKGTVSLALVSDREMRRVNRETRGKDEPTTVLSFAECDRKDVFRSGDESARCPYRGAVILAPDCIGKQGEDIVRFAVHGLLHLLGYTHTRVRDSIEMERVECRVLLRLRSASNYVSHRHRS